jgi:LmbE family N-acetylglucosaminyl deacetylase
MSVLVVVAHPDDETIGAGATLAALRDVRVLHLTDGAPRDPRFVSEHFHGTTEEYAAAREAEARAALALAHVDADRVRSLRFPDLEAAYDLDALTRQVSAALDRFEPDVVITHAYEGGHPDHDACAFAVHAARPKLLYEMPLYHAENGCFVAGTFLDGRDEIVIALDDDQRALKRRMFACYATQRDVLAQFAIEYERFRRAPQYDFTKPPHAGPLWYEILGMKKPA